MSSYKEKVCEVVSDAICGAAPHQRPGKSIWAASLSRYGSKEIGYSPQGELAAWDDAWKRIETTRAEAERPKVELPPVDELKPCPFCGGEAKAFKDVGNFWTVGHFACMDVTVSTLLFRERQSAIDAWNRRANG